jgi:hypothetical protein
VDTTTIQNQRTEHCELMNARRIVPAVAGTVVLGVLVSTSAAATHRAQLSFGPALALTNTPNFGGSEPSAFTDSRGGTWVTAHKTYYGLAASPNQTGGAAPVRAASWLWYSQDGKTFAPPPGNTALQEYQAQFGDEADIAPSPDGDVYVSDLNVASQTLSRWHVTKGGPTLASSKPLYDVTPGASTPPAAPSLGNDRPFIAAGRGGLLLLFTKPGLSSSLSVSRDYGATYTTPPFATGDAFCRPWADRTPGSHRLMAVCNTQDPAVPMPLAGPQTRLEAPLDIWTTDDYGLHWKKKTLHGPLNDNAGGGSDFPSVGQAPDGTLYVVSSYATHSDDPAQPVLSKAFSGAYDTNTIVWLLTSHDRGATWVRRDITPGPGIWTQLAVAVSPVDGHLGLVSYWRSGLGAPWTVKAGLFTGSTTPTMSNIDGGRMVAVGSEFTPQGDFLQPTIGFDNKLAAVWSSAESVSNTTEPVPTYAAGGKGGSATIFYARQR